jgi:hypothetical protein
MNKCVRLRYVKNAHVFKVSIEEMGSQKSKKPFNMSLVDVQVMSV